MEKAMPALAPALRLSLLRRLTVALLAFLGLAAAASAQWAWKDETGHTVFSDVPPPPSVKPGDIIRQPSPQSPAEARDVPERPADPVPAPAAPPPAAAAPLPRPTVADQEQAFRKRMKDRADAERKQAEASAQAARDAEDCQRAQGYLRMLEDGGRLVRTNPDGSREQVGDDQRAGEVERAKQVIKQACK
jgi:type IV secretory pathway VirB10-like protein